jgi:hypothetical protein
MMRKILYSPGFGAGWTSWEYDPEIKKFMLEYQPIIDALERGDDGVRVEPKLLYYEKDKIYATAQPDSIIIGDSNYKGCHPAVQQFARECMEKFGRVPYMGGLDDLEVATVEGRVRINEYDGNESYEEEGKDYGGWL